MTHRSQKMWAVAETPAPRSSATQRRGQATREAAQNTELCGRLRNVDDVVRRSRSKRAEPHRPGRSRVRSGSGFTITLWPPVVLSLTMAALGVQQASFERDWLAMHPVDGEVIGMIERLLEHGTRLAWPRISAGAS